MEPFWHGKLMYNESVLMISRDGKPAEASLLFKPKRILSVKNSGLNIEYKENVDWEYKDGKLRLLPGSKAIFMTESQLYPDSIKHVFPRKGGGKVLFHEGSYFHDRQLAVTYKHGREKWKGLIPVFQSENLPHTIEKLKRGQAINFLLYGDSIAAGANASGKSDAAPHLPDWGSLIVERLRKYYKADIAFTNTAVGGMDSKWGKDNVQKLVMDHAPDLVVIAFGMNDGTGKVEPETFKENISGIVEKVKESNKNAEFVLVAPMLPNPETLFLGTQEKFKAVLEELTAKGIVVVDMTEVHRELLKSKSYQDMTGNNINHPNDFLIRWYAQEIAGTLIP